MASDQENQKPAPEGQPGGKPEGRPQGAPEGKGKPPKDAKGGAPKDKGGGKGKADDKGGKGGPVEPIIAPRLRDLYRSKVRAAIAEKFGIKNPMAMPCVDKVTLNVNMGRHLDGNKIPPNVRTTVIDTLTKVSGQKPIVLKAKKSVANFKVREGAETAAMVTLRRDRMWHFLDRFINLATPRIKDFRGLKRDAFDRQGNYSTGLTEQGVFAEINMAEVQFTHGMHVNIGFRNSTPEMSRFVLEQLGMPFAKVEELKPQRRTTPPPQQPPQPAAAPAPAAAAAPAGAKG